MNKSTKGALAAGAAAVLLLGGAGTLAYWTAEDDVDGGLIEAGDLTLEVDSCGTAWLDAGDDSAVAVLVPGDEVYKDCEVTLSGSGDNLLATVGVDPDSVDDLDLGSPVADSLVVGAEVTAPAGIDTTAVPVSGDTAVTVRITVDWPYGAENNDSQGATASLDAITLVATQADPNP